MGLGRKKEDDQRKGSSTHCRRAPGGTTGLRRGKQCLFTLPFRTRYHCANLLEYGLVYYNLVTGYRYQGGGPFKYGHVNYNFGTRYRYQGGGSLRYGPVNYGFNWSKMAGLRRGRCQRCFSWRGDSPAPEPRYQTGVEWRVRTGSNEYYVLKLSVSRQPLQRGPPHRRTMVR